MRSGPARPQVWRGDRRRDWRIFGGVGAIPGELVGGLVGGGTGALTNPDEIDLGEPV